MGGGTPRGRGRVSRPAACGGESRGPVNLPFNDINCFLRGAQGAATPSHFL